MPPYTGAIGLTLIAVFFFAAYDVTTKIASVSVPLFMALWVRYAFQNAIILVLGAKQGNLQFIATKRHPLHCIRAVALLCSNGLSFLSFKYLPVAEVTAILMITPLLVTLLTTVFTGHVVRWRRWMFLAIGLIGAMLIVKPGQSAWDMAMLLPLGLLIANTAFQLLTSRLAQTDHPNTIFAHTSMIGGLSLSLALPWAWQSLPDLRLWGLLFATAVLSSLGHHLLVMAYARAPAPRITPFLYFQLVFATLGGWLVFQQMPDGWALLGIVLIAGAGIASGRRP
jgi:drug/metabolite transporter (DMT)-like permease